MGCIQVSEVSSYELLVHRVSSQLRDALDVDALVRACQQGRYDDREFYYEDIIRGVMGRVFKQCGGRLYWFSGSVWEYLPDVLLYNGFRDALVGVGEGFFSSIRSDVRRGLRGILGRMDYRCCSELGIRKDLVGFRNCVVDFADVETCGVWF